MEVLVAGATGFVGRAVCAALAARGDAVRAISRDPERARGGVPGAVRAFPTPAPGEPLAVEAVEGAGVAVLLAGEPIADGRWTAERKRRIRDSRVDLTRAVVEAMARASRPPRVLVSASAVGYYGDRGDERLDEGSPPGDDFLAGVCRAWEAEARSAEAAGARVVVLRLGMVLGRGGGALARLVPMYRLGLGGRLGGGDQWVSWVHLDDLVGMVLRAVDDEAWSGAVAAVAPEPVRQRELAAALGRAVHRPAVLPAPAWALRLALGEVAEVLTGGQRVLPARALALGFRFAWPRLGAALEELCGEGPTDQGVATSSQ